MALTSLPSPLTERQAAHLLRRTTFGPTIGQIQTFTGKTVTEAMDLLFDTSATDPAPPIDTATSSSWVNPPTTRKAIEDTNSEQDTLHDFFKAWHTDVMLQSGATINERITWFYHTHLPARWTRIRSSEAIYYQNCIFRFYALGSFKELFKKICIDNSMLKYLDGATNQKNSPNENFAREMFELYSIGRGEQVFNSAEPNNPDKDYTNFTEQDVQAATKVLTGWIFDEDFATDDADHGWPTGYLDATVDETNYHDGTNKTFSPRFDDTVINGSTTVDGAKTELDELIEMIFAKEETAKAIARKLYRFFVYHFISDEVETNVISELSANLIANDYDMPAVLKELLSSDFFYDANETTSVTSNDNIGALIKSPIELVLGTLRLFETETPDRETETQTFYDDFFGGILPRFKEQGLNYYEPFEVAGYPPYHQKPAFGRNWIMPAELAYRYQTGERLLKRPGYPSDDFSFSIDLVTWAGMWITYPDNATNLIDELTQYMLAVELSADRKNYFQTEILLKDETGSTVDWSAEWTAYTGGGSNATVKEQLERLVSSLMQTPEFQLL